MALVFDGQATDQWSKSKALFTAEYRVTLYQLLMSYLTSELDILYINCEPRELVESERYVTWCMQCTTSLDTTRPSTIFYRLLFN
jgi:hypothetical protein